MTKRMLRCGDSALCRLEGLVASQVSGKRNRHPPERLRQGGFAKDHGDQSTEDDPNKDFSIGWGSGLAIIQGDRLSRGKGLI